ncbi:MAG: hypothetical protein BWY71_02336 [Planctomycetes bacterium ADurb.Bin412]|nr:MAG: hypothetical protein BWY71_02336 [Planctomycetes bacterium ADurb.Bin412]
MGDEQCGVPACHTVHLRVDLRLCQGIQRRGGLVQDYKRRILVQRPGKGYLLPFPAGQLRRALLKGLADRSGNPAGQRGHPGFQPHFLHDGFQLFPVLRLPAGDVVPDTQIKQLEILEHGGNALQQALPVICFQRNIFVYILLIIGKVILLGKLLKCKTVHVHTDDKQSSVPA